MVEDDPAVLILQWLVLGLRDKKGFELLKRMRREPRRFLPDLGKVELGMRGRGIRDSHQVLGHGYNGRIPV